MENNEFRKNLLLHLDTLKRNLAAVPKEVLKTKYRKPYTRLCQDISADAAAYMKSILFSDIRIRADYRQEAIPLIQNAIDRSGLMKKISAALFATQDMAEFDRLLMMLKEQIQSALQPLYEQHMGIFISAECKNNPGKAPEPYCEVNGCILRDKIWIPLENTANSFLIIRLEEKKPAA